MKNKKNKVFVICTVRGASTEYQQKLEDYVKKLENEGNDVHLPHRDTNQNASGFDICTENMDAIIWADEVHIFYNPESQGTHFDMGVAFALKKSIKVIESVPLTEEKSYQRMLKEWEERTFKKGAKIKETYTDHWGNVVKVHENGTESSSGPRYTLQYGDYGHDNMYGWFVIDKDGKYVYFDDERYTEIHTKSLAFWEVMHQLHNLYPYPKYRVERGLNNKLFINDKMIEGVDLFPGKAMISIDYEVEYISVLIQDMIDSGKVKPWEFGI